MDRDIMTTDGERLVLSVHRSRGKEAMNGLERITIDPQVCLGQPTIRGMRITVSVVLRMLGGGQSVDEVLEAYPELEREDVLQAMQYAAWLASEQLRAVQT